MKTILFVLLLTYTILAQNLISEELYNRATNGSGIAQYTIGNMYETGAAGTRNMQEAYYWYRRSAKHLNGQAMQALAEIYFYGKSTNKNDCLYAYWIHEAMNLGDNTSRDFWEDHPVNISRDDYLRCGLTEREPYFY